MSERHFDSRANRDALDRWITRDDPPVIEEIVFDYEYDEDGNWHPVIPDDLPFDESTCARCGAIVGWYLGSHEDSYGREIEYMAQAHTWRDMTTGEYLCEDCVDEAREVG